MMPIRFAVLAVYIKYSYSNCSFTFVSRLETKKEDPTVRKLEDRISEMTGKESAILLASGTASCQVRIGVTRCRLNCSCVAVLF